MNYYEPKQRTGDGRWDYTRNNYPAGYCRKYQEFDTKLVPISEAEQEEYRATAHKHHTDGHATSEEACDCYKEWQLDHQLSLDRTMSNQQQKCKVCGEWTQKFAEVGNQVIILCEEHNNREEVAKIYEAPSWSMSSW